MKPEEIFENALGHVIVGILTFIGGYFLNYARVRWQDRKFQTFFGGVRNQERIKVVYGQHTELISLEDKSNPNFANA